MRTMHPTPEQEAMLELFDARMRRQFVKFNETVTKARLRVSDLVMNVSRGLFNHDQSRYLQEVAERNNVPYDPQRPFIEFRDLTATAVPGLIETEVVDPADALRPFSVTRQLGVEIETGLVGSTVVPHVSATTTPQWLANEATQATPSDPTLSAKTLTPKNVAVVTQFSRTCAKQVNAESFIQRELLGTVGTAIDQVVLAGSSASNQPDGLFNASGLQTLSGAALTGDSANILLQLSADKNASDDMISYLGTPTVRKILQGRERVTGSGAFVWDHNEVSGRPAAVTTDLPAGSLVCGPWPMIYLGIWGGGFQMEINPFDPTHFKSGVIQARLIVSCDVAVRHANAFVWASDVS